MDFCHFLRYHCLLTIFSPSSFICHDFIDCFHLNLSSLILLGVWYRCVQNSFTVVFTATRHLTGSLHCLEATFSVKCISVACDCLCQPITGLRDTLRGCDKKWGRKQRTAAPLWVNNCLMHWETHRVPASVQKKKKSLHFIFNYWDLMD